MTKLCLVCEACRVPRDVRESVLSIDRPPARPSRGKKHGFVVVISRTEHARDCAAHNGCASTGRAWWGRRQVPQSAGHSSSFFGGLPQGESIFCRYWYLRRPMLSFSATALRGRTDCQRRRARWDGRTSERAGSTHLYDRSEWWPMYDA